MVYLIGPLPVLALAVVPPTFIAVRKFGSFLRDLSHKTQAAAAEAASIAEVLLLDGMLSSHIGD